MGNNDNGNLTGTGDREGKFCPQKSLNFESREVTCTEE